MLTSLSGVALMLVAAPRRAIERASCSSTAMGKACLRWLGLCWEMLSMQQQVPGDTVC